MKGVLIMANNNGYIMQYDKENQRRIIVRVNRLNEKEMLDFLESQPSIQGYIKDLIRKDMEEKKLHH